MNCNWCEERFERFLDGELGTGERARLLRHVDACDACRSLLEELRVVDALLLQPRSIELAPNFTFATMAELRALQPPQVRRPPLAAYLVCYVVAAWSLAGAALLISPNFIRALSETALDSAHNVLAAIGGVGAVAIRLGDRGEFSSWTTLAGGVVLADLLLVLTLTVARPRIAERLRW